MKGLAELSEKLAEFAGIISGNRDFGVGSLEPQPVAQTVSFFRFDFFQVDNKCPVRSYKKRNMRQLLFHIGNGIADDFFLHFIAGK